MSKCNLSHALNSCSFFRVTSPAKIGILCDVMHEKQTNLLVIIDVVALLVLLYFHFSRFIIFFC